MLEAWSSLSAEIKGKNFQESHHLLQTKASKSNKDRTFVLHALLFGILTNREHARCFELLKAVESGSFESCVKTVLELIGRRHSDLLECTKRQLVVMFSKICASKQARSAAALLKVFVPIYVFADVVNEICMLWCKRDFYEYLGSYQETPLMAVRHILLLHCSRVPFLTCSKKVNSP